MAGRRPTVVKPSRSDEVLDPDQQLQITNRVRSQFESMMPKRPTKPNRSEPDSTVPPVPDEEDIHIPELNKLQSLQSHQSHTIFPSRSESDEQEEFVETQYYNELNSIDKQHHTTGNGFINSATEKKGNEYHLRLLGNDSSNGRYRETLFKSNPATNDWIPSVEDHQVRYVSSKPNRSESS